MKFSELKSTDVFRFDSTASDRARAIYGPCIRTKNGLDSDVTLFVSLSTGSSWAHETWGPEKVEVLWNMSELLGEK